MGLNRAHIENLIDSLEHLQDRLARQSDLFGDLESYCVFAGYPKSGHSLIGALLDAHPDMVIAHELDCLRCLNAGLGREPLLALTLEMADAFHAEKHQWNGHRYRVPGQWQGRYRRLKVLGDKKGGGTSRQLLHYPKLLDRLRSVLQLPIKVIHVVRHPAQNILSIQRQFAIAQEEAAELYFSMAQAVAAVKPSLSSSEIFELRYEQFLQDPVHLLEGLSRFLGQGVDPNYLEACAQIVQPDIGLAHRPAVLEPGVASLVARNAQRFDFLAVYPFEYP